MASSPLKNSNFDDLAASRRRDAARVVAPPARAGVLRRVTSVKFIEIDAVRLLLLRGGRYDTSALRTQAQQSGEIMALGRRNGARQGEFWVATHQLPTSPGHVFYEKPRTSFWRKGSSMSGSRNVCESYSCQTRASWIPPGVYFRMLLAGYFEGIGSQRGIAWRCSDSPSLQVPGDRSPQKSPPDHSSLSLIAGACRAKSTMPYSFGFSSWPVRKDCSTGSEVGVDSTTLEANAAMKSIVRRAIPARIGRLT